MSIKLKAVGKERPRWSSKHKYTYTPKKTKKFEKLIADSFFVFMKKKGFKTIEGPAYVGLTVHDKVPVSWSKKNKIDALTGKVRPTKTPDSDNILKAVLDGLNKIAYVDDKQVVEFSFERWYAEVELIKIVVNEIVL